MLPLVKTYAVLRIISFRPNRRGRWLPAACIAAALTFPLPLPADAAPIQGDTSAPVKFNAQQLSHDDAAQTVTAVGDVEFNQGQKILRADRVVYHLDTDTVEAEGNVSLLDDDGSVHFFDKASLKRDMKEGYVKNLLSLLNDGARFTAAEGTREKGTTLSLKNAAYTPCKVCEADPHPTWQIKADKIVHDEVKKEVKYKKARIEFLGVPLFFTPIFSHADPSVKRKSGFLRPNFGWSDNLGGFVKGGYYWSIAPDRDATVFVQPTTREGILTRGEWRQRFDKGEIMLDGSFVQSDRKEEDGRVETNRWRGHMFANGLFDLDEKWRAGFNVKRVSDKGYLALYDIYKENILENDIYAERFSGRDYSRIAAINAQDLRLGLRPVQPEILPMAEHHMLGAPRALFGGRWALDLTALDLQRIGPGQDMQRATTRLGWRRRDVSEKTGLVATYDAAADGSLYAIQHNTLNTLDNTSTSRGKIYTAVTGSYPLVKRAGSVQTMIEPVAGVSLASRVSNNPADIPNEDSQDVQINANSLFSENRFPGTDRQEGGARINYGVKTGIYADDGAYGRAFVGQSYRVDDNNGLFPQGSGLEDHFSDLVGQLSVGIGNRVNMDYSIQLDHATLAARRHEIQMAGGGDRLRLDTRFIYLDAIAGTGFVTPREQWQVGGEYKLTQNWSVNASTLYDFGEEKGVRRASAGLTYADECFSFGIQGGRNLINDASGQNGTVIVLRLGLKNIGEFQASQKVDSKTLERFP